MRFLTPADYARLVTPATADGGPWAPSDTGVRSAGAVDALGNGRVIRYIFSDSSVARDNHVIKADAWDLMNFLSNPVFLWAHDQDSPPIGKVTQIAASGQQLVGAVEYMDRDISPFADSIFQMTKAGFLNATSVSWLPVEWKYSSDRSRPGGIDFSRVELLEISQVPVPALPSALATARSRGIDTGPVFDWATRMLDSGGYAALPRAELENLRKEARMPALKIKLSDVQELPVPEPEPTETTVAAPPANMRAMSKDFRKRGLYELSMLCDLLSYADYCCRCVEQEAIDEGDGSEVPAQMRAWIDEGNRIIAAMAAEETSENIEGTQDVGRQVEAAVQRALSGLGLAREGKRLSAETERCMRSAHDHVQQAAELIRSVVDPADDADPEDVGDDATDPERALRERRERAQAARARVAA